MRARHLPLALAPLLLVACGLPEEPTGTATEKLTVCAAGSTLEGVDVSHYDGAIDWSMVAGSGRSFAFLKATEGTGFTDPTFTTNWAGLQQNNLVGGAYHFFHADLDPTMQAQFYLSTIATVTGHPLPVLDLETTNGQSPGTIAANAVTWLNAVGAATGMKPIVYVSPSFFAALNGPAGFDSDLLWIANWQVNCPDIPSPPWSTWSFWQYDDAATVPGIPGSGNVDVNQFNGTLAQLQALAGGGGGAGSTTSSTSTSSTTGAGGASTTGSTTGAGGASTTSATGTTSGAGGAATGSTGSGAGPTGTGAGGAGPSATGSGVGVTAGSGVGTGTGSGAGGGGINACGTTPVSSSGCSVGARGGEGTERGAWLAGLALLVVGRRRRSARA